MTNAIGPALGRSGARAAGGGVSGRGCPCWGAGYPIQAALPLGAGDGALLRAPDRCYVLDVVRGPARNDAGPAVRARRRRKSLAPALRPGARPPRQGTRRSEAVSARVPGGIGRPAPYTPVGAAGSFRPGARVVHVPGAVCAGARDRWEAPPGATAPARRWPRPGWRTRAPCRRRPASARGASAWVDGWSQGGTCVRKATIRVGRNRCSRGSGEGGRPDVPRGRAKNVRSSLQPVLQARRKQGSARAAGHARP